jgi:RimJ/RimL family protein N-acetyltransferase
MEIEIPIPKHFGSFLIRDWEARDGVPLANIEYDQEVKQYLKMPNLPKEQFIEEFNPRNVRGWALESRTENSLIGAIDISRFGDNNRKKELRILLSKEFRRKGIAAEAATFLVSCLFGVDWIDSVVGVVHPQNHSSLQLLRKLGFIYAGVTEDSQNDIYELKRDLFRQ